MLREYENSGKGSASTKSFRQYVLDWNENVRGAVKPQTSVWEMKRVERHVFSKKIGGRELGDFKISEITSDIIAKILRDMEKANVQKPLTATIDKVYRTLCRVFHTAVKKKHIKVNPMADIEYKLKSKPPKGYLAIPPEKRDGILRALESNAYLNVLCKTMWFAGLRIGEAQALRWQDVDLEGKTISVKQAATIVPTMDAQTKQRRNITMIDTPKTEASIRDIDIPTYWSPY